MRQIETFFVSLHNKTIKTMKIYTSYFANSKNLAREGIMMISIARYSPKWYDGLRYTVVAPTSYMLSAACSHEEYVRRYKDILSHFNADSIVNAITTMSKGVDVALCCYEKPGEFCHRHLLAEWLTKNGHEVKEWEPAQKKVDAQQLTLFD